MEPWVVEFIKVWQENRTEIAQLLLEAGETNPYAPMKGYRLEDVYQLVDGGFAMMQEELVQSGNEIWDTYMNTVVPGFLAQGQPIGVLVGTATMNAAILAAFLGPKAKKKFRAQVIRFVANFYMKLNMGMTKIAFEVAAAG